MKSLFHLLCGAAAAAFSGNGAPAQPFPSKPIQVLVPYSAGDAADIVARIVARKLSSGITVVRSTTVTTDFLNLSRASHPCDTLHETPLGSFRHSLGIGRACCASRHHSGSARGVFERQLRAFHRTRLLSLRRTDQILRASQAAGGNHGEAKRRSNSSR